MKSPIKATLSSWPKPSGIWSRVHIDFAGEFLGLYYVVVVDSYSKWPEIFIVSNITSAAAISKLTEINARFGIMSILVSDNGPAFISEEFDNFCKSEGIYDIRTPAYHPQSNGQAERFVDTFKRVLKKAKGEESIPNVLQTFLQRYRMTPNAQLPNNCSPAEIMFGRKPNSVLDLVRPRSKFDVIRKAKHRLFYPNQKVYVRDFRNKNIVWTPAVIITRIGSVIYDVECDGNVWRLHANQLRIRYEYESEKSDPTLSLLYDVFDTPPVNAQQSEVLSASTQPNEEPSETPTSSIPVVPVVPVRPQRNRQPPPRIDFSRSVKGRYLDFDAGARK